MSSVDVGIPPLIARNPATNREIGHVPASDPSAVPTVARRVREAQGAWAATPIKERLRLIDKWRGLIAREADSWAELLREEIGKPKGEALGELVSTLDAMRWTVKNARRVTAPQRIGAGLQALMLIPSARLHWKPLGVIGMIGTWNYPVFLNAPPIAQALAVGNGVLWKPSELAPKTGARLQESLDQAGFPAGLVSAVQGGAEVGRALIDSGVDKVVFTGGIVNGRRVLAELGARGIPALAELSGYDAAIIMPDAEIEKVAKPLTWAVFTAAGQACVAVKRIYVVGDPRPWAEAIRDRARALRVGDPSEGEVDLGPLITPEARDRFHGFVRAAVRAGAEVLTGGEPLDRPGNFYAPTVLLADTPGPETALAGCFGPCVVIRGVKTTEEAIAETNASEYALGASVWGADTRAARAVGGRLQSGMLWINDAVTPSAHAAAPFGGVKGSGHGRTRGDIGLLEFAAPQTVHVQSFRLPRVHLFPYRAGFEKILKAYIQFIHGG